MTQTTNLINTLKFQEYETIEFVLLQKAIVYNWRQAGTTKTVYYGTAQRSSFYYDEDGNKVPQIETGSLLRSEFTPEQFELLTVELIENKIPFKVL